MKTLIGFFVLCAALMPPRLDAQVPPVNPNAAQPGVARPVVTAPTVGAAGTNATTVRTNRVSVPRQFPTRANPAGGPLTTPSAGPAPSAAGQVNPAGPAGANVPGGAVADGAADGAISTEAAIKAQKFKNMPLDQFIDVYAKVSGRTVLRGSGLPLNAQITLEPVSSLTPQETLQAYDTVLALNNITMIPTGEKFVVAVPKTEAHPEGEAFGNRSASDLPEASR